MATSLMPNPKPQFCDTNGAPLAGGSLTFYSPGTTDLKTIYTDSGGGTPAANPLTLDSAGRAAVWLSGYYDVVLKTSAGVTVWTVLNVSSMADTTIAQSEWVVQDDVLTYIAATQFSVPGNETGTYQAGRRIKATVAAGTIYGTITTSAYAATITTVTCSWDTGSLDSGLSAVSVGILAVTPTSMPAAYATGYIYGLAVSNATGDPTNDLTVGIGACRSGDDTLSMRLVSALTKRVDATFTAGSGGGGLDTSTIGASRVMVYIYAIGDSTGVKTTDVLFSKSATAPTMPTGFDKKRLIFAVPWAGAAFDTFAALGTGPTRKLLMTTDTVACYGPAYLTAAYADLDLTGFVPKGQRAFLSAFSTTSIFLYIARRKGDAINPAAAVYAPAALPAGPLSVLTDANGFVQHGSPMAYAENITVRCAGYEMEL